jgi:hypothetical protein
MSGCSHSSGTGSDENVDLELDELRGKTGKGLRLAVSKSKLKRDVLAFDVPEITKPEPQGRNCEMSRGVGAQNARRSGRRRWGVEHTHQWDPAPRLPLGGERRREEAAGHSVEECAPVHYWITSSARASSDGGMVSPSAFAVLRLMTSSNRVGRSTGKSAGLVPFKILPANDPRRRQPSTRLGP